MWRSVIAVGMFAFSSLAVAETAVEEADDTLRDERGYFFGYSFI